MLIICRALRTMRNYGKMRGRRTLIELFQIVEENDKSNAFFCYNITIVENHRVVVVLLVF